MQSLRSRQACLCGIAIAKVAFHRKAKNLTKWCEFPARRDLGPGLPTGRHINLVIGLREHVS